VLHILDNSLSRKEPVLIGYQVPPSGGKTVLSVSIAGLLAQKYRDKKVLYVCYNTLVRKAVANACAQAGMPFWIASSRWVAGKLVSAVRPSNSSISMSAAEKRKRFLEGKSSGFRNKEGPMEVVLARADAQTVHHCAIIISDLQSACVLLDMDPEQYVAYIDGK
jgi:hypothetical protein